MSRAMVKCVVCGDLRIDAERSQEELREQLRGKGWRFADWGVVCSPCRRNMREKGWRSYEAVVKVKHEN